VSVGPDLRTWLLEEHGDVRARIERQVLSLVPPERRRELADDGGSSIDALLWHVARHQDLAVNGVVRGSEQVVERWADRLGPQARSPGSGLEEAEQRDVTATLDPEVLAGYVLDVYDTTAAWLASVPLGSFENVPDSSAALAAVGVSHDAYPWLHAMWDGKTVAFHVRWEAIGHGLNHVGEMVAVRNRLGLSPF
jgi:hypothetical protein